MNDKKVKKKSKEEPKLEVTVVSTKKYTFELITTSDGITSMKRTNDGFNPLELLGITQKITSEVLLQMVGKMPPPDVVKRVVIKD